MHNKVAKSARNKYENYPGQEITNDHNFKFNQSPYIPLSINNPPSNDYISNWMSIPASFWIDPLIASSVKSTSLNLRELLRHLIRRTVSPQMLPAQLPLILFHAERGRRAPCGQVNRMKFIFNMLWSLPYGDPGFAPRLRRMDAYLLVDCADIGRIKMQPSSVSHSLPPQLLKHSPSWILKLKNNRDAEMNRLLRTRSEYSTHIVVNKNHTMCTRYFPS